MKNRAFTLIELLAVIVILAIIALIATPIILGIIRNAKDQSEVRSAELYVKAAELAIARKNLTQELSNTTCEVQSNGNMKCGTLDVEVDVDKTTATGGTIVFQRGKIISVENLKIGNNTYRMDENRKIVKQDSSSTPVGFTGTVYMSLMSLEKELPEEMLSGGVLVAGIPVHDGDSITEWCKVKPAHQAWCAVVPSYKEWCAVATDGSMNSCDNGYSLNSQEECLNEISEAISAGNVSEGQFTCEQGETVPAYNSCSDGNFEFPTQQQCLDEIAGSEGVPEGTTCEQVEIAPAYNSCTDENSSYLTQQKCLDSIDESEDATCSPGTKTSQIFQKNVENDYYLKYEVEENIIKATYACIKYEKDGTKKEACVRGGGSTYNSETDEWTTSPYYGTYDGMSSTNVSEISNPTGNIAVLKSMQDDGFSCFFSDTYSACSGASLGLSASTGGVIAHPIPYDTSCEFYGDSSSCARQST